LKNEIEKKSIKKEKKDSSQPDLTRQTVDLDHETRIKVNKNKL
jgi:hypothetical protein